MTWADLKPWLGKIAPMLGATLGGPLGAAAGAVVGKALGVEDPTPEKVMKTITDGNLTPEQMTSLQLAELAHAEKMAELGFKNVQDLAELEFKDRDSARNREIQVKDKTPSIGFYLLTTGFYGLIAFFCLCALKPDLKPNAEVMDILKIMVGSLGTAWIGSVNYYYGSTSGSRSKDLLLHNSTPVTKE